MVLFASADALFAPPSVFAPIVPSGPNTFRFDDLANWTGGIVGNVFQHTPGPGEAVTFGEDTEIGAAGLTFSLGGIGSSLTLRSAGPADHALTLFGGLTLTGSSNGSTVVFGSTTAGEGLVLVLGDDLTFSVGTNDTLRIRGAIEDNSDGYALTKDGAGEMVLEAQTSHGGGTVVNDGTLRVDVSDALATEGAVLVNSSGTLSLQANQRVSELSGLGTVTLSNQSVLTIDPGAEADELFQGVIQGAGSVVKTGSGTQRLGGVNGYTNGTWVTGGTLVVGSDANLGAAPGGLFFDGGTLQLGGTFSSVRAVTVNSGGGNIDSDGHDLTLSGAISGAGELQKTGAGTLTLNGGNNSLAGYTTIVEGTLRAGAPGSLSANSVVRLNGGAFLDIAASSTIKGIHDYGWPYTGVVTIGSGAALTIAYGAEGAFEGTITGAGSLVKNGAGTQVFYDTDYTGGTTINEGRLQFGTGGSQGSLSGDVANNATLVFARDYYEFGGVISGGGDVEVSGVLELTAANSYTGGTLVRDYGMLILGNASGETLAAGGDVTLMGESTLRVDYDQTIRGLESGDATSAVEIADGRTFTVNLPTGGTSTFAGEIFGGAGSVLKKDGPGTLYFFGTASAHLVSSFSFELEPSAPFSAWVAAGTLQIGDGGVDGIFLGDITVDSAGKVVVDRSDDNEFPFGFAGTGEVVKQGASNLTLTGENTFTGTLTIEDGTITVGADYAAAAGVRVVTNAGGTFAVGAGVTTGITVAGLTGTGATTIAAGKKLTVETVEPQSYAGAISGDGSLRKRGTAAYALSGANAYLGDTWIENGTLIAAAEGALSPGSVFRVNSGATLQVNSSNSIAGLDDFNPGASGTVNVASAAVLTIDNGISNTFSGALAGAGGLTKTGAGVLTFAGGSTFSGAVRIEEGTIAVGAPVAFTAGEVTVEAGGMFDVANSTSVASLAGEGMTLVRAGATLTLAAPGILDSDITGAGGVTLQNGNQSTAVTTVMRTQGFTGATSVAAGTLRFAGSSEAVGENIYGSDISLGAGTKVEFSRSDSLYGYSGAISGSGSVVKAGAGTLVLSGASSYGGQTTVGGGTLKAAATNALPATTRVAVANGATLNVAADQTINGFVSGGSFLGSIVVEAAQVLNVTLGGAEWGTEFGGVISGGGALRVGRSDFGHAVMLTGSNTYTGGTTIEEDGALVLGTGFSPGGSIVGNVVNHGVLTFQPGNNVVFGGVISGMGRVTHGLATGGPDLAETRLTAANTYAGGTRVYGGVLFAMNANPSESATGWGLVEVLDGGILAGTGRVAGPLVVDFGGIVAPASALGTPGTLRVGPTTFGGEGEFMFQIADADGVAGTDYSLLAISGQLALTATGADRFAIQMFSVGASGGVANFDPEQAYSWMFVTTTGGISGFDPAKFDFDLENFSVGLTGSFSVGHVENSLLINYSPAAIPEPSTWVLLGAGLAVLLLVFRGRVRRG